MADGMTTLYECPHCSPWQGVLGTYFSDCDGDESECYWFLRSNPDQPICGLKVDFMVNPGFDWNEYAISKIEKEKYQGGKVMRKSDLTTYHVVLFRKGSMAHVCETACGNRIFLYTNGSGWDTFGIISDDLSGHRHCWNPDMNDIMAVYEMESGGDFVKSNMSGWKDRKPVWKRVEVKEMTIAEIEKELGYPVKVIKEGNNE